MERKVVALMSNTLRQSLRTQCLSSRSTVDLLNILSEQNKRRCQTQLEALGKSVKQKTQQQTFKKQAAVLIPLCFVDCQPSIIFTLRSSKLKRHAGQVSFPGGMVNDDDGDKIETAVRESREELGLSSSNIDIWGQMLPLPDRTGEIQITPILANIGTVNINDLQLDYNEVECVFTRDIPSLCSAKNFAQTTFVTGSAGYTLPVFLGGEHKIWGLTAIILHQTLSLIAPDNAIKETQSLEIYKDPKLS